MDSTDQEEYGVLDLLAFRCNRLMSDLEKASTKEHRQTLLDAYIESVDNSAQLSKPINDFIDGLDWFNVTEPLSFAEDKHSLRGKIVILDFFTYCCINCMHILPDLHRLESEFTADDGVITVGVHCAKFENEKDSENILSAIQRYNIVHPVVNDINSKMWEDLGVQCWPTLVILGPNANPLFVLMGEGKYDLLASYVSTALRYYNEMGIILDHSLPLSPSTGHVVASQLKFPAKIACSAVPSSGEQSEMFAIVDSGHHRVLIVNAAGDVLHRIGGKRPGSDDGNFETARFNSPQGVAFLDNDTLFVADTENHLIRRINLEQRLVVTVAGTGRQGDDRVGGAHGPIQPLSSPWDCVVYRTRDMDMSFHEDERNVPEKDVLFIAMAGTHQLWALFLSDTIWWRYKRHEAHTCCAIAGNGAEENRNNIYPHNAAFAQPSGLALARDHKELFLADAESSSVRKLALADGKVAAVAGGDRNPSNLFAFGDVDGEKFSAKFQHPLGVAYDPMRQCVYVADTYNHKIKQIDWATNNAVTCPFVDERDDTAYVFGEPGGLCVDASGAHLYVADTNKHDIVVVTLATGKCRRMAFRFAERPEKRREHDYELQFDRIKIKPVGGNIKLTIKLVFNGDVHFSDGAPQRWTCKTPNELWTIRQREGTCRVKECVEINVTVPPYGKHISKVAALAPVDQHGDTIVIAFKLNLCARDVCFARTFAIGFPVMHDTDGLDCFMEDIFVKIDEKNVIL